ncbi:hypothetical protein Calkr_0623 [Caldicellulosiruptor acetigenus I77R1B]|uniref:Exonuclease SbcC n=1 Tax=Caldicellulosiruptor acetigenus (strain ATCC 700853 / DSM 12137 / I77R1B) TaxID=632335 RepID=E4SA90_CALA7|nr:DUF6079 family protein [Caldicellulosiruptor acetigenus]ADQ40167.1 hypothetical protein Calkr_0623 [Caldicellulosiruptor acetigenus I77R1B]
MRYKDVINFEPIETLIQLVDANEKEKAKNLVKTFVMSDSMAEVLCDIVIPQLQFEEFNDNKGIFVVGNYGTGKSHLMAVISAIAEDKDLLDYVNNEKFKKAAEKIAGKFEVVRIEIGSVTTSLRDIVLKRDIESDLKRRGIDYAFPSMNEISNNKDSIIEMMAKFEEKYPEKGYLIVIDELLDFLRTRKEHELRLDLGFLRELGEVCKNTRVRIIAGVQESLFDGPSFSHVSDKIMQVKDRFENIIIKKEDIAYVVSQRLLKKSETQKAFIREHLKKFSNLYKNMGDRLEEYVELYPIHPSYIDVFQKVLIAEQREILKTISRTISKLLDEEIPEDDTGIISYDSYWDFIKEMPAARANPDVRQVIDASSVLENIINNSFPKKVYKNYAIKIIKALSVYRLATGDIHIPLGLTIENIKDDLCFNIPDLPEKEEDFLITTIESIMKEILKTVDNKFISYNKENNQYYLDVAKVGIDYMAKIEEKAELIDDDVVNRHFYNIILRLLNWEEKAATPYVKGHRIWEYDLIWEDKNIERHGYLFLGTPNERPTAQPPRDFYIYFTRLYEFNDWEDNKRDDEVFFSFSLHDDTLITKLKMYAAAHELSEGVDTSSRNSYLKWATKFEKEILEIINNNKNTCFNVTYKGETKSMFEILQGRVPSNKTIKELVDKAASICLSQHFSNLYPEYPKFSITVTRNNLSELTKQVLNYIAGKKTDTAAKILDAFGLLENERITTKKSPYAKYFADLVAKLPPGKVINRNEIFEKWYSEEDVDKRFKFEPNFVVMILAALIYTGDIVLIGEQGKEYNAGNLDKLASTNLVNLINFKYITRPKEIPIKVLERLFELLDLPPGQIKNSSQMEQGIANMQSKVENLIKNTIQISERVSNNILIWDKEVFKESEKRKFREDLNNFKNFLDGLKRYNTIARLKTFNFSKDEIEEKFEALKVIEKVKKALDFKEQVDDVVNYLKNAELVTDSEEIKKMIQDMKDELNNILQDVDKLDDFVIKDFKNKLEMVKKAYIQAYFEKHKKCRLDINGDEKKKKILSSKEFNNLRKLKSIKDIFSIQKFEEIEKKLSSIKTCFNLIEEELKKQPVCPHCGFKPNNEEGMSASMLLEKVEDDIYTMIDETKEKILKALDDRVVSENIKLLKEQERKEIEKFIEKREFEEDISPYFITGINNLMEGFDKIEFDVNQLKNYISKKGPMTVDEFKDTIEKFIETMIKGKTKDKIRIIVN